LNLWKLCWPPDSERLAVIHPLARPVFSSESALVL
jgi:hypothetical protein